MKKTLFILITLICLNITHNLFAQEIKKMETMNYQGMIQSIKDQDQLYINEIQFNIFDAETAGTCIWGPQTFNPIIDDDGHFNVELGPKDENKNDQNENAPRLISNVFNGEERFIEMTIDGETLSPRQKISATPFAFHAKSVEGIHRSNDGNVGIGTNEPNHILHVKADKAVGLFESTNNAAFIRLSTNEGIDNRIELCNRTGGRASIWVAKAGDVLNVTQDGNVGIGTTNPQFPLQIKQSGPSGIALERESHKTISLSNAGGGLLISNYTDNQDLMTIKQNGNVGIYKDLTVNGNINGNTKINGKLDILNGGVHIKGNSTFSDNITAKNATINSNLTVKGNINGNTKINGKLDVLTGGAHIKGNSTFSDNITAKNATINSNLTVKGKCNLVPVGVIMPYMGTTAPDGWLMCDGKTALTSPKYADLRTIVGNTVPDLRGRFLRGVSADSNRDPDVGKRTGGVKGTNSPGSYQDDAFQGHGHEWRYDDRADSGKGCGVGYYKGIKRRDAVLDPKTIAKYGTARIAKETRPKNIYVNYIIKY